MYRLAYAPEHDCATAGAALADCFLHARSIERYTNRDTGFKDVEDEVLWKASVDYEIFRDTLHRTRDAIFQMIRDVRCDESKTSSSFRNMETSIIAARKKAAAERVARLANKNVHEFHKARTSKKSTAEAQAWKEYTAALQQLKKNKSAPPERRQELNSRWPRAARYAAYLQAVKNAKKAVEGNIDIWKENIMKAATDNNA